MQSLRIFHLLIVIALCCGNFTLCGATRTLDEINEEQKKKKEEEKKATEEANRKEKATLKTAEEKQKTDKTVKPQGNALSNQTQPASKTYTLAEEVIGLQKPFEIKNIDNTALMNADPKAVELFEAVTKKEKGKDILKNPGEIIGLWGQLLEISTNNPFAGTAKSRFKEWQATVAVLDKHQENLDKISKLIPADIIKADQKASLVSQHLDEFGVMFGTEEVLKITKKSESAAEIAKNEAFRTKIKDIQIARCNNNSGKDCFNAGKYFAANENEKLSYLDKACGLKYRPGCNEIKKIKAAEEAEKARIAAEEKRKADEEAKRIKDEKDRKIKEELNQAGRKKRLTIATATFIPGIVITILGGVSLHGMKKAGKDHDKYYQKYLEAKSNYEAEKYRKKAQDADKKHKTYMGLGIAGVSAGIALIATGITFYSINFEGEKKVKKKYNLSFGASPTDGTLQFALNW